MPEWKQFARLLNSVRMDVRLTVRASSSKSKTQSTARIFELDRRLRDMYATLEPLNISCGRSEMILELQHYQLLLLHAVYHICQMFLHSSVLRVFSDYHEDTAISPSINRTCAREVLASATSFAELLHEVLSSSPDMTKVYPFVAYTASIAGSVFKTLVSIHSPDA